MRRRDLVVAGHRLAMLDVGDSERVCLLVHGLAASWDWWMPTIPALTGTHRVIAVDLPGFGRSEDSGSYGPVALADVLVELLDQEGIARVDLVGHSLGTAIAGELAVRHPGRVDRLVFTGGPITSVIDLLNHPLRTLRRQPKVASFLVEVLTAGIKPPRFLQQLIISRAWARRIALRAYTPHPERLDASLVAGVLTGAGAPAVLPTLHRLWRRYDLRAMLQRLNCPTLVIAGERDTISPTSDAEEFMRITGAEVTVEFMAGAGHMAMLEDPQTFNKLLTNFLAEGTPS